MEFKKATTYTLQVKGGISSSTIRRMKANESISTNTLDMLCKVLDCKIEEILVFVPDK
jgi:DNA-binding Xre family transcriptional regulator